MSPAVRNLSTFFVKSNLIVFAARPPNQARPRGPITISFAPGTPNGDRAALVSEGWTAVAFCRQMFPRTGRLSRHTYKTQIEWLVRYCR